MKKVLHAIFAAFICVLCLSLSVGIFFTGPSQSGANENLSDFPSLKTKDGEINREYLGQVSGWIDDHFLLRQEWISLHNWISGKVFGVSGNDSVILGTDGWLYYSDTLADYTSTNPMSGRELFGAQRNLQLMADYCRENGRAFLFVIAPNKNSLYGGNMPGYGHIGENTNAQRLLQRLEAAGVGTVDLFAQFSGQEEVLYFEHDSHWNTKGAALCADLITAGFGLESEYYGGDFSQKTPHTGDLFEMLYPSFADKEQDYIYGGNLEYSFTTSATRPDAIVLSTEGGGQGTLLAYRDSFGNLLFPFLADTFASARFSRAAAYDLTYESEYVLIELVERNLRQLTQNLHIMPAPKVTVELPEKISGTIAAETSQRKELQQVRGEIPAVDEDSPIYVVCSDGIYEAFCLEKTGFGLSLDPGCQPEYVVCKSGGALVAYEMEIING